MRNTGGRSGPSAGVWGAYVRAARDGALLSRSQLAEKVGVDDSTVYRWERWGSRPENADTVARFARAVQVDVDEALAAAGLRPAGTEPAGPTQVLDEETELIRSASLDARHKKLLAEWNELDRERDRQRRMDNLRFWIEHLRKGT